MNIKIKKHLLLYKDYKLKCAIGKSGIISAKKEGDLATPKGTFELGTFYYRKDNNKTLKCRIKKKIIKKKWDGAMIVEVKSTIKKLVSLLNMEQKNFIEKIKFMIYSST